MGNILKIISTDSGTNESYAPSQSLRPRYSKFTALLRTLDAVTIYAAFGLSVYLTGQSLMGSYVSTVHDIHYSCGGDMFAWQS